MAKDGNVESANSKLDSFMDTPNGVLVLSLATDLMREMKLTYTEQVFLQETGFDPNTTYDAKVNKEMVRLFNIKKGEQKPASIVSGLLDWYQENGDKQEPNVSYIVDQWSSGHVE